MDPMRISRDFHVVSMGSYVSSRMDTTWKSREIRMGPWILHGISVKQGMREVVDISALAACTHLQHLNLRNTRVSDISAVAACTNLRYLNLSHTRIPTCKEEAA